MPDADGCRHIRGVIGPDEYHEHIDDNAFTNMMARHTIARALAAAAWLKAQWPGDWVRVAAAVGLDDADIDLADSRVAIDGGIHIAALGGLWMIAVLGFAGVSLHDDVVAIDPRLPPGWTGMRFPIQWHGSRLDIRIEGSPLRVLVSLGAGQPVWLRVFGEARHLAEGEQCYVPGERSA